MNLSRLFAGHLFWRGAYLLTSVGVTILMARYLQAAATGWVFYFISWLSLALLVAMAGMDAAATYFVAAGSIKAERMESFALVWTVISAFVAVMVAQFFTNKGVETVNRETVIAFSLFFICGNMLITFLNALFYARRDFITPNIVFTATNTMLCGWLLSGLSGGSLQIAGFSFLEIYFFSFLFQGILVWLIYRLRQPRLLYWEWMPTKEVKQLLLYSGWAFGANFFFFIVTRVDYWLIDAFVPDPGALGNYIQASRLVQLFQMVPSVLAAAVFPLAAGGWEPKMQVRIATMSRILMGVYAFILLLLAFFGRWFFPFVFGPSFNNMYTYFLLLIPGLLALSALAFISAYLAAKNQVRYNLLGALVAAVVIAVAGFLLIPLYGISAAALISSIGYILCFAVGAFYFQRQTGIHWWKFFIWQKGDLAFITQVLHQIKTTAGKKPHAS